MKIIKSFLNRQEFVLSQQYLLREAAPADFDSIEELVLETMQEFGVSRKNQNGLIPDDIKNIEAYYNNGFFGVIEANQQIDGCFALKATEDTRVELRRMYFNPTARGKGLGSRLLKYLIEVLTEAGYDEITLETSSKMIAAQHLYRKFNFVEIEDPSSTSACDKSFILTLKQKHREV